MREADTIRDTSTILSWPHAWSSSVRARFCGASSPSSIASIKPWERPLAFDWNPAGKYSARGFGVTGGNQICVAVSAAAVSLTAE